MTSKRRQLSSPSLSQQSSSGDSVVKLRKQLLAVAWVQCDNANCLKWRKISQTVAERLMKDTVWTCDQNEDHNFNRCSIPEEDTEYFDRLAKCCKLDIIKSELTLGTLVWAKIQGYCRWPALVTVDPLNGKHVDGDVCETQWYHVEFMGGERSHRWVTSKSIEIFGPGNIYQDTGMKSRCESVRYQVGNKNMKRKKSAMRKRIDKDIYKGKHTVQTAIEEALELLPMKPKERLETCWFVETNVRGDDVVVTKGLKKNEVKKKYKQCQQPRGVENSLCRRGRGNYKTLAQKRSRKYERKDHRGLSWTRKSVDYNDIKENREKGNNVKRIIRGRKNIGCEISSSDIIHNKLGKTGLPGFLSSMVDVSKEQRLIIDAEMFQKQEATFKQDVINFMAKYGLQLSAEPVWQNIRIGYYGLFLAVDGHNGFMNVTENHLWTSVYTEVAHQNSKSGGSIAKRYYRRNLYPYELYLSHQDFSMIVWELKESQKEKKKKITPSDAGDSGVYVDDSKTQSQTDDDFDNSDVVNELNELDEILKTIDTNIGINNPAKSYPVSCLPEELDHFITLESDSEDVERNSNVVPVLGSNHKIVSSYDLLNHGMSPRVNILTGSELGHPKSPDENAQVVPELDFPSSMESSGSGLIASQDTTEEKVLHEMQALQYDMDALQNQIHLL